MIKKIGNGDESTNIMGRYIVFLYYYSSPPLPKECFLELSDDIAYRNMLLFPFGGNRIHFELPVFEDHSYNSICYYPRVKGLVERFKKYDEEYIIFRAGNPKNGSTVIGYYRVGEIYCQETDLFNRNGILWGIKTSDTHLIRKDAIPSEYKGRGSPTSENEKWSGPLNELLERIKKHKDISKKYQEETKRLIKILKNREEMNEWKKYCQSCEKQKKCKFHGQAKRYEKEHPDSSIFSAINRVYTSNLYSRNVLTHLDKIYSEG